MKVLHLLWLPCIADADIIFSSCGFFFFLLFFHRRVSVITDWMSTILPHMMWKDGMLVSWSLTSLFSTNMAISETMDGMSEVCCLQLTENTGCKESPSGHHRTTLSSCIFVTKACICNRKKTIKQQYLLHISIQYGELWPFAH